MRIKDLQRESYQRAVSKGFYDPLPSVPERLMLIVSEASEALEAYRDDHVTTIIERDGKPTGFPSELADIVIRVCDLAEHMKIDLENEIRIKSDFNESRPYKHGRKRL